MHTSGHGTEDASSSLSAARLHAAPRPVDRPERSLILLMLVGGPSQLETWDPKPDAPAEVRGPFRSIATSVAGVRIVEHLPRMAKRLDRVTLLRSLTHDAAPIHETGHQLIQTGHLCRLGQEHPHVGSVVAKLKGSRQGLAPFVITPGPIGNTGVSVPHGQTGGALGPACDPFVVGADRALPLDGSRAESETARDGLTRMPHQAFNLSAEREAVRDAYGRNSFGRSCLLARRLVEAGVRVVTVNMYQTVFNQVTWDCHGARPFSTLDDYAREVLPSFDLAFSALLDDLDRRGLLDSTFVVATGEFGRTPRLNAAGGRDHWPGVWSAVVAGGGTVGGQVVGASDATASSPADRPVAPAELVATMYRSLAIDPSQSHTLGQGMPVALVEQAAPIAELFG
jgi:hypothetical protein